MKQLSCMCDFIVIGGGVAGTVAAIAAARLGAETVLVQNRPVLGGPSSSECSQNSDGAFLTGAPEYVNRGAMETGILEEMRREAYFRSANGWRQHWSLVMREWAEREENLTLLLNTEVYEVETQGNHIVSLKARTLGSETEYLLRAPLFADCSGDSFVGFSAGAEYRIGREARHEFQESLAPEHPDRKFVFSTTTTTAQEIAWNKVPAGVEVFFCPVDMGVFVRAVLRMIRPSALVIFETEIWPNMVLLTKKSGAKVFLVNARISDRSVKGYRRFRMFFAPVLTAFDRIGVQTELDCERFLSVAPEARVVVTGNIKFDQCPPADLKGIDLAPFFGTDFLALLACSTHAPEEKLILETFLEVRKRHPELKFHLSAPREKIARLCRSVWNLGQRR